MHFFRTGKIVHLASQLAVLCRLTSLILGMSSKEHNEVYPSVGFLEGDKIMIGLRRLQLRSGFHPYILGDSLPVQPAILLAVEISLRQITDVDLVTHLVHCDSCASLHLRETLGMAVLANCLLTKVVDCDIIVAGKNSCSMTTVLLSWNFPSQNALTPLMGHNCRCKLPEFTQLEIIPGNQCHYQPLHTCSSIN